MTPIEAVAEMRARIARGERCGVLFGRERNGLETSEVANADALIMIPVNSRFASLNLAQAVLILGYEWMRASEGQSLGRVTTYETPDRGGPQHGRRPARRRRRSCSASSSTWRPSSTASGSSIRRTSARRWCAISAPCSPEWARRSRRCAPFVVLLQRLQKARDMPASRAASRHDLAKFWAERCRTKRRQIC